MRTPFSYRLMKSGEETTVCEITRKVFDRFVAPLYPKEGIEEFYRISTPESLKYAIDHAGHVVHIALHNQEVVGVIKMKNINHISWLFVCGRHQGRGIGRYLIRVALKQCLKTSPEIQQITVNSSPNSYAAYERFGFSAKGPETVGNGIICKPMEISIENLR